MWVFDVSDATPANWGFAYNDASSNPMPLFQACTSATCTSGGKAVNRQPITSKPSLAKHPRRTLATSAPNVLVYFGTGQYLTSADNNSAGQQSYYGVWDGGTYGLTARTAPLKRSDLVTQVHTEAPANSGLRTGTSNTVNYDPSSLTPEYGWKIDLAEPKERVVVNSGFSGEILFFNTLIPSVSSCSGGGDGWKMNVDLLTGGQPPFAVLDLNHDGDITNDAVVSGTKTGGVPASSRFIDLGGNKLLRLTPDSRGNLTGDEVQQGVGSRSRRISWTHLEYE